MKYQIIETFRVRTPKKEIELQPGQVVALREGKALKLITEGRVRPLDETNPKLYLDTLSSQEAFDPHGALASLLECARKKGISDAQVASIVDDLIRTNPLKAPWGIKIKNSPVLKGYWIVSDEAKKFVTTQDVIFTAEDIRLLAEVREIFGIQAIEGKKRDGAGQ